ncbi:hypothetical protein KIN20_005862 [Parelaphostrongylus tenuis]|uniref:Uncharacterized protein n=1 Tax=Parelaphostrongylus tenuis TaxID=148309 RepID=A0AAD5QKJ4_PARTN|nr:hypothetical protein KIN20_005862 [Parelaphostrongylus tenuis]
MPRFKETLWLNVYVDHIKCGTRKHLLGVCHEESVHQSTNTTFNNGLYYITDSETLLIFVVIISHATTR